MSKKIFRMILLLLATCYSLLATHQVWAGVCKDNYCHGNVSGLTASSQTFSDYVDPVSTNSATGKCGTCHRTAQFSDSAARRTDGTTVIINTAPAGGSHFIHTSTTTYNFSCKLCHSQTLVNWVENSTVLLSTAVHVVNRLTDIRFSTWPAIMTRVGYSTPTYMNINAYDNYFSTPPNDNYTNAKCENLYCHSQGKKDYQVPLSTPFWGGSLTPVTSTCTWCHGGVANYNVLTSSHLIHVSTNTLSREYAYTCETCHDYTVQGSTTIINYSMHVSSIANLAFSTSTTVGYNRTVSSYNVNATYTVFVSSVSCTKVYCHSDGTRIKSGSLGIWATPYWWR